MMVMRACGGHGDRGEVAENRTVTQYLVVGASVQGRSKRLYMSGVERRGDGYV